MPAGHETLRERKKENEEKGGGTGGGEGGGGGRFSGLYKETRTPRTAHEFTTHGALLAVLHLCRVPAT